jgi:hypothetical protein
LGNNSIKYIKENIGPLCFLGSTSAAAWYLKHNKATNNRLLKIKENKKLNRHSVFNFIQQYRASCYALLLIGIIKMQHNLLFNEEYRPYMKLLLFAGASISIKEYVAELTFWFIFVFLNRKIGGKRITFTWMEQNENTYTIDDIKQKIEDVLFKFKKPLLFLGPVFYIWKVHEFIQLIKTNPKITILIYFCLLVEKTIYFAKSKVDETNRSDILKQGYVIDSSDKEKFEYTDGGNVVIINYDQLSDDAKKQYEDNDIITTAVKREFACFFSNRIRFHLINYCNKKDNTELDRALSYFYLLMSSHCFCLGPNSCLHGHGHSLCCHGKFNLIYNNFPTDINTCFNDYLSLAENSLFYDVNKEAINYENINIKSKEAIPFGGQVNELELVKKINKINFFNFLQNINLLLHENI